MHKQRAALWLAFIVIGVVSILAFATIQRLNTASQRVDRIQGTLTELNLFLSNLKDVESSARGYILTGDDRYARTLSRAADLVRSDTSRLRILGSDEKLGPIVGSLLHLADLRVSHSRQLAAKRSVPGAAQDLFDPGADIMDVIRKRAAIISAYQMRALGAERAALERQAWITSLSLAAGIASCLVLIAWLFTIRGREVHARRALEAELRALNSELEDRVQERTSQVRRAGELLNAVVENLPDMILLKEPSGEGFRYILVNAAGERLLGRKRDDIVGKREHDLFPSEEADSVVRTNKAVLESGKPRTFTERKLTTPAGVRTVETRMVPIANARGSPALILAIVRDVTENREREVQLRQLQRLDAIGRLTGGVAHDFNNLLAIIHGNAELLRERTEDGTEPAEMIEDVIGAAGRGAELVRRLLAYARMQHLEPGAIDLNARLPNVIGLLHRVLGEDVAVRSRPADGLWPANVDPTQVDDAIVNLAINARDAMPGGGTLTIETSNVHLDEDYAAHHVEVRPGEYVMLAVSDTGSGMPQDVIDRAFEPFFTTKEEGHGTGLGLSQVYGWVKQSGGHIKIYSELGHGTTIKLYLPRAETQAEAGQGAPDPGTPCGDETVLVVEDNPNVRKTVIRQLHDLGYETVEAESGGQALELARGGLEFDLLLTDVIMPGGMTGYQLADELRSERPSLKVLFTSGYTELAASNGSPARSDPLLSKPYRKQDLGRAVRAVLDIDEPGDAPSAS
ncbi:MAG TPA: ATP-binding protein [Sphingomicrobium sp.]|nr:ATP-binding protein [Sphingomicrobium sp.]